MTTQEETEALAAADRVLVILERGNDPPNHEDVERVAKYLLSSSKAARGMREALEGARGALERIAGDTKNGDGPRSIAYGEMKHIDAALSPNRPLAEEEK